MAEKGTRHRSSTGNSRKKEGRARLENRMRGPRRAGEGRGGAGGGGFRVGEQGRESAAAEPRSKQGIIEPPHQQHVKVESEDRGHKERGKRDEYGSEP